jgi:hypothetical protein
VRERKREKERKKERKKERGGKRANLAFVNFLGLLDAQAW